MAADNIHEPQPQPSPETRIAAAHARAEAICREFRRYDAELAREVAEDPENYRILVLEKAVDHALQAASCAQYEPGA